MKKSILVVTTLMLVLCLGISVCATEQNISMHLTVTSGGQVMVEGMYYGEDMTPLTFILEKEGVSSGDGICAEETILAVLNQPFSFTATIPDTMGSGVYIVTLQDEAGNSLTKSFTYVNEIEKQEFLFMLQASESPEQLKEILLQSETMLGSFGIDYELFLCQPQDIQSQAAAFLYTCMESLTADTFSQVFNSSLGLALYNSGARVEGLDLISLIYDGKLPDTTLLPEVVAQMGDSYASIEEIQYAFGISYGLTTIRYATMSSIKDVLQVFVQETGECHQIIIKLNNLSVSCQHNAYAEILSNAFALKTVADLEATLERAYAISINSSSQSGGSSGGGGGGGGGSISGETPSGTKITLSNVRTAPGKTIQIDVILSENTGFSNIGLEIAYNSDIFTLVDVAGASEVGATFISAESFDKNPYNLAWHATEDNTYNGRLATLTFLVNEAASEGIHFIDVSYFKGIQGDYTDGYDVNYDENYNSLNLVYMSGEITVLILPGDINCDGRVTERDATTLLRYLANWEFPEDSYDELALDVDGDGEINNKDATTLMRYLAGWDIEL